MTERKRRKILNVRLGLFRACSSLPEFSTGLCITSSRGVSPPTRFTLFRFLIHRLISIVGAAGTTGWPDPSTVEQRLTFFLVSLSLSLCISFLSFFFTSFVPGEGQGEGVVLLCYGSRKLLSSYSPALAAFMLFTELFLLEHTARVMSG